uniref:Uncharacterized protein n=1 Tax=Moniliophthora roreri TaxID=221103 RepID=A0A0W0FNM0_MONRR
MKKDIDSKSWCLTVIRSKGLHLLRPERTWRPVVCIIVHATPEVTYETTLGLDGQNPNQKEVCVIGPNATPDTNVSIQVVYQPPGKKKIKRMKRVPLAYCTCSLGDVLKKQVSQEEKRHAQLRLQAQSTLKHSNKRKNRNSQPPVLYVRVHEPSRSNMEQAYELNADEYASSRMSLYTPARYISLTSDHLEVWDDSHTEQTLSLPSSPIDEAIERQASVTSVKIRYGDKEQAPRRRKKRGARGFVVHSDDDEALSVYCPDSSSSEEEFSWLESPYLSLSDHERESLFCVSPVSAIPDLTASMHSQHFECEHDPFIGQEPLREPEENWCWHHFEKFLCIFTVYGELCSAASVLQRSRTQHTDGSTSSELENSWESATVIESGEFSRLEKEGKERVEKVYQRLQNEWLYVGGLLVALAAVDTAVFAISSDALFAVSNIAKPMIAASSVFSGCGIVCAAWFLWWYGWGSVVYLGGHGDSESDLGGVDWFMVGPSSFFATLTYSGYAVVQNRALDINKTYVSFALAAPVVAYDAAPVIVWVICCGVAVGMCGQFIAWGLVRVILGTKAVVKDVAKGVKRLGNAIGIRGAESTAAT